MKKAGIIFSILLFLLIYRETSAQVSPYQTPPKWMFGYGAGFDFGTSPYTNSPPLILTGNPTNNGGGNSIDAVGGMEASSAICDPNSNLLFYTNFFRYYNYPGNIGFNYPGGPSGSGSSTDGGVIIPDPANPATQFYIFVANDITGSAAGVLKGVNYYKATLPITSSSISGPFSLADASMVDEALCSGSDGNDGYWMVAHGRAASNGTSFLVWHITSSGVSAVSVQAVPNPGVPFPAPANNNNIGNPTATVKINRCQDRIAYVVGSYVEVYQWNKNTGTIGNVLYRQNGIACCASYGLEFSPDGSYVYFSELNGSLKRIDVSSQTGAPIIIANGSVNPSCSELGTMQLGPDDKIYVTNCANATNEEVYIGVVNNPNDTNCNYVGKGVLLKPKNTNQYPSVSRGIANMAWMTPNEPVIILTNGESCSKITHTIRFTTYFNTPIDIRTTPASSIKWSFDNGQTWINGNGTNSFTHNYGGSVNTTAMVRFYDKTCNNYEWSASVPVSTTCTTPVCDAPSASAGSDMVICDVNEIILNGNNPGSGVGTWTIVNGTGDIESLNDKNSKIKNLTPNSTVKARWTISKSGCPSTFDEIEVLTFSKPVANAGSDLSPCEGTVVNLNADIPSDGTGKWIVINNSSVKIESIDDPTSSLIELPIGESILQWKVSNGNCPIATDEVKITVLPKTPIAEITGGDINICTSSFDLTANSPIEGVTGIWTVVEGTGQLMNEKSHFTRITELSDGLNKVMWTLNGTCGTESAIKEIYVGTGNYNLLSSELNDTVCFGTSVKVNLITEGNVINPVTYHWIFSENANDTIKVVNETYEINSANEGWLTFTVYARDFGECKSNNSIRDSVYFVKEQQFIIPNLITPNNDEMNDCLILKDNNGLKPLLGSKFCLFNRWGQIVYRNENYDEANFCADNLSDGVYYYTLVPFCGEIVKGWLNIISSNPEFKE